VGPIKFPFLVILIDYIINYFLKRQFCFPRAKKFSSFWSAYIIPSKFPFLEFHKKAILLPQRNFFFTIFESHMTCLPKPSNLSPFGYFTVRIPFLFWKINPPVGPFVAYVIHQKYPLLAFPFQETHPINPSTHTLGPCLIGNDPGCWYHPLWLAENPYGQHFQQDSPLQV